MLGIVVSRADSASVHIGEHLRELIDWERHEDDSRPDATGGGAVYRAGGGLSPRVRTAPPRPGAPGGGV